MKPKDSDQVGFADSLQILIQGLLEIDNIAISYLVLDVKRDSAAKSKAIASSKTAKMIALMIQSAGVSTNTVLSVCYEGKMNIRDAYPIARSVFETLVNAIYIMAGGDELADQAERHATQKSYRNQKRDSGNDAIRASVEVTNRPTPPKELKEYLDEFTSRKGKEKNWTDLSITERINAIYGTYGFEIAIRLHVANLLIYSNSSEIIHGSFYGVMYFWGWVGEHKMPKSADEFNGLVDSHKGNIFAALFMSWTSFLSAFGTKYEHQGISEKTKAIFEGFRKVVTEETK